MDRTHNKSENIPWNIQVKHRLMNVACRRSWREMRMVSTRMGRRMVFEIRLKYIQTLRRAGPESPISLSYTTFPVDALDFDANNEPEVRTLTYHDRVHVYKKLN